MIDQLQNLGIEVKATQHGDVKVKCPKCSETRKNKNEPCLSVNVDTGVWNCHNCGWAGGIKHEVKPKKEYFIPQMGELKNLSDKVIKWFENRKISNQTLLRYKIGEGVEWFPQVQGERTCIQYHYFSPEGVLINIKSRDAQKNFKLVSKAMLVPFGMDVAFQNSDKEVLWVEGENDTLACYESGVRFSISVPNGASKGSAKLEWLDECWDLFAGKKHYIGVDMDEAGRALAKELSRRLGRENCLTVEWPEKDANDTLMIHGPEAVKAAVENATPYPIEGIEDAVSVYDKMMHLYEQGAPEGYHVGWAMDEEFRILPRTVALITGVPSHGKTTWLKNYMYRLAMLHDMKFLVYSAEESSIEDALADMCSIAFRKPFFHHPLRERITQEELDEVRGWMAEHFKYYSLTDNDQDVESVLEKAEEMVKRTGINAVVIDNMSTIERRLKGNNKHDAVGEMLNAIGRSAKKNDINYFLVAHPKKMSKLPNGLYEIPTGYDVSDSAHWYNLPDVGFTVYRNFHPDKNWTEVHRWKVRSRHAGSIGEDYFKFDVASGSFSNIAPVNDGSNKSKFVGQNLVDEKAQKFATLL